MLFSQLPHATAQTAQNFTKLRGVMTALAAIHAPLLQYLHFFEFSGPTAAPRKNSNASGGTTRAAGGDYSENQVTPSYDSLTPQVYGDICQTDQIYQQQAARELADLRTEDLLAFLPDFFARFQYALLKYEETLGTSQAPQWDGILKKIPTARKESLSLAITSEANAMQLVYEMIMPACTEIGNPAFVMMDSLLLARLSRYKSTNISFGTSSIGTMLANIGGVPIVLSGTNGLGDGATKVFPWAAGTATKVLVASTLERADLTCATWVGFDLKDQGLTGTSYKTLIEGGFAPGILRNKAVKLIEDIQYS